MSSSLLIVDTGLPWSSPTRAGALAAWLRWRSDVGGTTGSFGSVKVLLVDDEAHVAASLNVGLRAEGFVVVHAETGTEGLWQATENYFDVIVLDITGPSGYEILRRIRERQIWTPVLMLTAKDGEYEQADAFDLGADDYVIKPFSLVVLVARLRALVRRAAPQRPVVLTAGDLVLDPGRHLVTRAGCPSI